MKRVALFIVIHFHVLNDDILAFLLIGPVCSTRFDTVPLRASIGSIWLDGEHSVSKKIPPEVFWHFIANGREFLVQILHAYYKFQSTFDYNFFYSIICNFNEVMPC